MGTRPENKGQENETQKAILLLCSFSCPSVQRKSGNKKRHPRTMRPEMPLSETRLRFQSVLFFALRWRCCRRWGTFFSRLFLLLADQNSLYSDLWQSKRTPSRSEAVFFNQLSNSLPASQHIAGTRKAKSSPESLVNRHVNTPIPL